MLDMHWNTVLMSDSTENTMPPSIEYASQPAERKAAAHIGGAYDIKALILELRRALRDRPDATMIIETGSVTILRLSPEGPDVTAFVTPGRCALSIGAWHDDMQSLDMTIDYVKLTLDGKMRVRVDKISGKTWQNALERQQEDGTWREESVLTYPRFNLFGRRKTTQYLQNAS